MTLQRCHDEDSKRDLFLECSSLPPICGIVCLGAAIAERILTAF